MHGPTARMIVAVLVSTASLSSVVAQQHSAPAKTAAVAPPRVALPGPLKPAAGPPPGSLHIRVYSLKYGSGETVIRAIEALAGPAIKAVLDPRTGSIIVSAPPEFQTAVEQLVQVLDTPRALTQPARQTRIIKLQHCSPTEAINACRNLIAKEQSTLVVVPDQQSKSLIASGSPEDLDALAQFIKLYDTPGEPTEAAVLTLQDRSAAEIARSVLGPLAKPPTVVSLDRESGTLLVMGTKQQVDALRKVAGQLDRPRPPLRLTFYFIEKAVDQKPSRPLPQGLAKAAEVLAEYGFEKRQLLATLVVGAIADTNTRFQTAGSLVEGGSTLEFSVEGTARLEEGNDSARLSLTAAVNSGGKPTTSRPVMASARPSVRGRQASRLFYVESTITVPIGDYVVIAAAPSDYEPQQAVAMILRAEIEHR